MRPYFRFVVAFVVLQAIFAVAQDLSVVAELPGAAASYPRLVSTLSLAKNGPTFLVNVTPTSVRTWPVGRASEPVVSALPPDAWPYEMPAFADFNGDGFTDLAIGGTNGISFLKGDGTGRFVRAATLAPGFQPTMLAVGDFNGDGRPDLLAPRGNELSCFLSTGAFAFAPPRTTAVTTYGGVYKATAGDVDADGRADLVIAPGRGPVSVWRSGGDGTFTLLSADLGAYYPSQPILADLDGDGLPEIIFYSASPFPPFPISVYKNDGGGRFHFLAALNTGSGVGLPFAVDVDGRPEIVFMEQQFPSGPTLVTSKLAGGAFTKSTLTLPDTHMTFVGAVDWDGDGRPEFVGAGADRLQIFGRSGARTDVTVVPVLLSTSGLLGSRFDSDLLLTNSGTSPAHATLHYTSSTGGGTGAVETDLAPGRQLFAPSAVGFLRDAGLSIAAEGNVIGTLRIEVTGASSPGAVSAAVRTTTPTGAGVAYGGSPLVALLRGPSVVPWLVETAKDRTNLALVNAGAPSDGSVTLRVEIHPGDGASTPVVLPDVVLEPGAFRQVGRVLAAAGSTAQLAFARITRASGNAPYLAWASVNDAGSGDASFVVAVPEGPWLYGPWVVPSAVQTARYATEFVASNPGADPVTLQMTLVTTGTILNETLAPGATFYLPDLFSEFRRRGLPGAPAADAQVVSPLYVSPSGWPRQVFAGIRVSSASPGGRSYGVFEPAIPQDSLGAFFAVVPDLRQDGRARTNLGILNLDTSSSPMLFRVEITDGETGHLVATRDDLRLAGNELQQLNAVLNDSAPGTKRAWARVTPLPQFARSARFAAYAVVNDGPEPGQGTDDGSFIPAIPE